MENYGAELARHMAAKAAVLRKHRNRRRNALAKLDRAHIEPPKPYRRVLRLRDRTGPRETFAQAQNRAEKRRFERMAHRHWHGYTLPGATERARGERRRQRAHRRRMASR